MIFHQCVAISQKEYKIEKKLLLNTKKNFYMIYHTAISDDLLWLFWVISASTSRDSHKASILENTASHDLWLYTTV